MTPLCYAIVVVDMSRACYIIIGCLVVAHLAAPGTSHAASPNLFDLAKKSLSHSQTFKKRPIRKEFVIPKSLEPAVQFWRDIYSAYDRSQVVLHDTKYLQIIYGVVDLSDITPRIDPFAAFSPEIVEARKQRVKAVMDHIRTALVRLAENPSRADITKPEQKIVQLFEHIPGDAEKFRDAAEEHRLRSQTGLRDRFHAGVIMSGKYLATIETIFREEGIPWEISRLPFVESMFDLHAYSKVGASGIWQFMPGTAKLMGLTHNEILDERNDPLAATRAAAHLLKKNFEMLGTWPLAINAYNAGPGRLRQAVQQLGTTSIATIIQQFDHGGYQFASRNFYPEFLAALNTFETRDKCFGATTLSAPLAFDTVVTPKTVIMPQLAEHTQVNLDAMWELNPGFTPAVYQGSKAIPAGYVVKVPQQQSRSFMAAMEHLSDPAVAASK